MTELQQSHGVQYMGEGMGCLACGLSDTPAEQTSNGTICDNLQNLDLSGVNWWWIIGAAAAGFAIGRMSKRRYQRAK